MNTEKQAHTPEPWRTDYVGTRILAREARHTEILVAKVEPYVFGDENYSGTPNAARIVACVNACAGLDPSALPALIEAAEASTVALDKYAERPVDANDDPRSWHALQDLTRSVEAIRAALAACRGSK